jgi:hypothetical protein
MVRFKKRSIGRRKVRLISRSWQDFRSSQAVVQLQKCGGTICQILARKREVLVRRSFNCPPSPAMSPAYLYQRCGSQYPPVYRPKSAGMRDSSKGGPCNPTVQTAVPRRTDQCGGRCKTRAEPSLTIARMLKLAGRYIPAMHCPSRAERSLRTFPKF